MPTQKRIGIYLSMTIGVCVCMASLSIQPFQAGADIPHISGCKFSKTQLADPVEMNTVVTQAKAKTLHVANYVFDCPNPNAVRAFWTNGTSDHKKISSTSSLQLSQFSLLVWFKTTKNYIPNPIKGGEGMMITKGGWISNNKGEQLSYGIWVSDANHLRAGFETVDGTDNILTTSGIKVNDGLWHHGAITYDSSKLKLYLDGKLSKEMVTSAQPENNDIPLVIGKNPLERKDGYFKGSLAEIKVFNKALSEAEIANHYNNHNGLVYSTG